jgi:hypothetical protein
MKSYFAQFASAIALRDQSSSCTSEPIILDVPPGESAATVSEKVRIFSFVNCSVVLLGKVAWRDAYSYAVFGSFS